MIFSRLFNFNKKTELLDYFGRHNIPKTGTHNGESIRFAQVEPIPQPLSQERIMKLSRHNFPEINLETAGITLIGLVKRDNTLKTSYVITPIDTISVPIQYMLNGEDKDITQEGFGLNTRTSVLKKSGIISLDEASNKLLHVFPNILLYGQYQNDDDYFANLQKPVIGRKNDPDNNTDIFYMNTYSLLPSGHITVFKGRFESEAEMVKMKEYIASKTATLYNK